MKVGEQPVYPHASPRILLQVVLIISPKHVLQHPECTLVATNLAVTCTVRGVSVVGSNPGTQSTGPGPSHKEAEKLGVLAPQVLP